MNKSRLIWGIICLGLAVLLAVLALVLPAGKVVFMVGDTNTPWLPPVVLGILGIVLLATAGRGGKEAAQVASVDEEKVALNKRLETAGWGCFLIMLGGFMFVPHETIAEGFWSVGVGVIMLSGFTAVLGIIALITGVAQLLGIDLPGLAILLIVLGAYLILKPWFDKRQLLGKVEEG